MCRSSRSMGVPVLYNFKESDIKWISYKPKAAMRVLDDIFPDGMRIPEYFIDKNVIHLPTVKCHIYTGTTGAMKNAFGRTPYYKEDTIRIRSSTRP